MSNLKTLAGRLFKLVFSWYLLLAIVVTCVQLGIEYASVRATIASDLVSLARSFSPSVSDAMWTYDQPLLESLARGIDQTAIITGVKVENSWGETVVSDGHVPPASEPAENSLLAPFQTHAVMLQSKSLSESHTPRKLGRLVLYSDHAVVLERVKNSFLVILINSIIKTAGLWLIFYWAITWSLSRPLTELSEAVASLDLKSDEEGEPTLLKYPYHDEIGLLVASLNDMRVRLSASHRELEQKVSERTHELAAANQKLEALSSIDGLTGIANRRSFDAAYASEWKRGLRVQQPLAVLMLDVDLFKNFNDYYGHQAGDECLRSIANILRECCRRSSDLAARYGGEEFVVIAANTNAASAMCLAEEIRQSVEQLGLEHTRSPHRQVTVSIGVAVRVPGQNIASDKLIRLADNALYQAKDQGRNCCIQALIDPLATE